MCEKNHADRIHTEHAVLDIGQDVGALIIYTNEQLRGKEIEVCPQGYDGKMIHTQVLERRVNGRTYFAALYLELPATTYDILDDDLQAIDSVTIVGGQVTELDWTSAKLLFQPVLAN
ncbi:MAG TPA: hypothetical protein VHV10_09355 [Ktedonobacteraceae bacterium]|jgi:hypothetical protein|nr:hypothetical protein [Ktedonobacteraceae bacterium]